MTDTLKKTQWLPSFYYDDGFGLMNSLKEGGSFGVLRPHMRTDDVANDLCLLSTMNALTTGLNQSTYIAVTLCDESIET